MNVVFRADASRRLGTGHVMRCLTLAAALREEGWEATFICREASGDLIDLIESEKGFPVHRLPEEAHPDEDARRSAEYLERQRPDWLVVDHYALNRTWETQLRPYTQRLMVIDDLANRPHDCDLLLDQNYLPDLSRYDALVPSACRKLLGPKYALLREEFRSARAHVQARSGEVKRILVSFGGSDLGNETLKALRALRRLEGNVAVNIIAGATNPHTAELREFIADMAEATLHVQVDNMAELMAKADLCIGAGGSSTWERCCLGLPSVVVTVADNQEALTAALAVDGYLLYLGKNSSVSEHDLCRAVACMQNNLLAEGFSKRGLALVDGRGAHRVVSALNATRSVRIRKAETSDSETLFAWRNAAIVRESSLDASPISPERHHEWFQATLKNPDRHLLVGELDNLPIGVVRYDIDRSRREAEISIYLAPRQLGKGLGASLLASGEAWLSNRESNVSCLKALVKPENEASIKLFLNALFEIEYVGLAKELGD